MPLPQENINSHHPVPEKQDILAGTSHKEIINDKSSVPKSSNLLTAQDVIDEIFVKIEEVFNFDSTKETKVQKSSLENKTAALQKNKIARKKVATAVRNLNKVSKAKQRSLLLTPKKAKSQNKNALNNTIKLSSENFNTNNKNSDNSTNQLANNFSL